MPSKPFNVNAYGNPRAKARRQNNPAAAGSSILVLMKTVYTNLLTDSTKFPIAPVAPKTVSDIHAEASDISTTPNAKHFPVDIKSVRSQLSNTSQRQIDKSNLNTTKPADEISPQADLPTTQANQGGVSVQNCPQRLRGSPAGVAGNSSFADPNIHEDEAAINKLDIEPENGANGGVALTTGESYSKAPKAPQVKSKLDSQAQLKHLQDLTLKKIQRQGKNRRTGDEKHNTTSLKDLDLARTPVNPRKPSVSERPWAQGSPVIEGAQGEEYTGREDTQKPSSRIPEIPSSRFIDTDATDKQVIPVIADSNLQRKISDTVLQELEVPQKRARWASKQSMQAEHEETNSNAWGSAAPSDATRGTNPTDNRYGRLLNKTAPAPEEETIADWDGKLLPAPADWGDRPRFNNNSATFKQRFDQWLPHDIETEGKHRRFNNGIEYIIISPEELEDLCNHADGISMASRGVTIDTRNAARYGYPVEVDNATKYSTPIEEHDFEDWGKLDPTDPDNAKHGKERSQNLIDNWLRHLENSRAKSIKVGEKSQHQSLENKLEEVDEDMQGLTRVRPTLNIYLRPATKADLPELTRIYNWYITHTTRPVETQEITESDMRSRMEMSQGGKLPFLVAGKKSQKGAKAIEYDDGEAELYRQANLPFTQRKARGITRIEQLAGFCCLQEFTAADYVEHITGEMEIYVDSDYTRMGVGRCLIDKMLEICDRSYLRRTLCDFHCEQSIRHNYGPGGARDLHKFYIIVRKWHTPKAAKFSVLDGQRVRNNAYIKTQTHETDYEVWQKSWFEKLGFEEEGILKKAGAKNGR